MSPFKPAWRRRSAIGALLFSLAPSSIPSGGTFTRSTTATYTDQSGIVQTAAINTLRSGHYIGGVQSILLEGQRTNSCLWSRDLTAASWSAAGTGSATQNAVGLDGTANSATTLTDSDAASIYDRDQTITIANDSATHSVVVFFRKDTDQTRFPGVQLQLLGGTTTLSRITHLNTQTGAIVAQSASAGTTQRVVDAGLWWAVELTATNNTSGNTAMVVRAFPAAATVIGTNNAAATGSCVVGQVQVELNSGFYSSPIFTTTVAVTRGADDPRYTVGINDPFTLYVKQIDLGTGQGSSQRIASLVSASAHAASVYRNTTTNITEQFVDGVGNPAVGAGPPATVIGDTMEYRLTCVGRQFQVSGTPNGGSEASSVLSAAGADATPFVRLDVNTATGASPGFAAFLSVKIASGVQSLATMRSL